MTKSFDALVEKIDISSSLRDLKKSLIQYRYKRSMKENQVLEVKWMMNWLIKKLKKLDRCCSSDEKIVIEIFLKIWNEQKFFCHDENEFHKEWQSHLMHWLKKWYFIKLFERHEKTLIQYRYEWRMKKNQVFQVEQMMKWGHLMHWLKNYILSSIRDMKKTLIQHRYKTAAAAATFYPEDKVIFIQ